MITKIDALLSLVPKAKFHTNDSNIAWEDNRPQPSESEIQAEVIRLQAEYNTQEYARNREEAYPSTGDQLDYIYHNGVAKWKTDMIDPVKTKYPKG